jgi:PAS domain S-box-containing protein
MDVQFRSVVEVLPDGVLLASRDGTIIFANHAAEDLLGYAEGDLLNLPLDSLVPGGLLHTRRPMGQATALVASRRDGSDLPVDVSLSPLSDGCVVATFRDARGRLRVESDLRAQAEELDACLAQASSQARILHSIVDTISDGVIVLDLLGRVQLINPPALRMYPAAGQDKGRLPFARIVEKSGTFLSDQTTPCRIDEIVASRALAGQNVDGLEIFVRPPPRPRASGPS